MVKKVAEVMGVLVAIPEKWGDTTGEWWDEGPAPELLNGIAPPLELNSLKERAKCSLLKVIHFLEIVMKTYHKRSPTNIGLGAKTPMPMWE